MVSSMRWVKRIFSRSLFPQIRTEYCNCVLFILKLFCISSTDIILVFSLLTWTTFSTTFKYVLFLSGVFSDNFEHVFHGCLSSEIILKFKSKSMKALEGTKCQKNYFSIRFRGVFHGGLYLLLKILLFYQFCAKTFSKSHFSQTAKL